MEDYIEIAKRLYPDWRGDMGRLCAYDPIIDHFGTVAIRIDDQDYQGDTRVLYADTGRGFGCLTFGWGSCSGCDALQACHTWGDLANLINELEGAIRWCGRDEMLKFFREHDWAGDCGGGKEGQRQFVDEVIKYLSSPEEG